MKCLGLRIPAYNLVLGRGGDLPQKQHQRQVIQAQADQVRSLCQIQTILAAGAVAVEQQPVATQKIQIHSPRAIATGVLVAEQEPRHAASTSWTTLDLMEICLNLGLTE